MKYYIRIEQDGGCCQSLCPNDLGVENVYEVCPSTHTKFFRLKNIEYRNGNIYSDGKTVCHATPYQKILDKRTLLGYIKEEAVLVEASGLAPGLFDQQLLELRIKKTSLAAQLKEQYPEKRALSISINESVGINDVVIEASGNEPE